MEKHQQNKFLYYIQNYYVVKFIFFLLCFFLLLLLLLSLFHPYGSYIIPFFASKYKYIVRIVLCTIPKNSIEWQRKVQNNIIWVCLCVEHVCSIINWNRTHKCMSHNFSKLLLVVRSSSTSSTSSSCCCCYHLLWCFYYLFIFFFLLLFTLKLKKNSAQN